MMLVVVLLILLVAHWLRPAFVNVLLLTPEDKRIQFK